MLKPVTTIALAMGLSAAHADELKPLAAERVSIGGMEGVAYFSNEPDGFRVVTTLVEGENGKPIRMIATLVDGQSIRLSVPGDVDQAEEAVELFRDGDVLVVRDPLEPLTASIE
jgi:hypothetical protein